MGHCIAAVEFSQNSLRFVKSNPHDAIVILSFVTLFHDPMFLKCALISNHVEK